MTVLVRALGLATAGYSVAILFAPRLLARPCGLTDAADQVPRPTALLIQAIGVRDTAIGLAMLAVPTGTALRTALAARVAADIGDAVVFGRGLPDPARRRKVAGFALAWGALCGAAGLRAR